ncbi:MAG TPA: LysM peptidoglycan-binding domain-containing protein [Verrucomicrobiae bacterium]|jgi:LysM repeat protein
MNIPSPFVPQGTQPQRGKSSLYFKVLMIVTVHVVLIGGMLLQGCKDTAKETAKDPGLVSAGTDTTSASLTNTPAMPAPEPAMSPITTASSISNQAMSTLPAVQLPSSQSNPSAPVTSAPMAAIPATVQAAPTVAISGDYAIAKGDTLAAIAKRNSVSLHSLMEANPGINAKRLKIGQKLQIPASTGALASSASSSKTASESSAASGAEASSDGSTYVVKSGDTLGKIAHAHGTSYKKIMALNDLKTTGIRVGQKLKMPAPKPAGAEPIPASAALNPAPGPVSAASTPSTGAN